MRRTPLIATALTAVGASVLWMAGCRPAPPKSPLSHSTAHSRPPAQTVAVGVSCDSGWVNTWVDPWTVTIDSGDAVAWVLDTTAQSDTITILAKTENGKPWPFPGGPPAGGKGRGKGPHTGPATGPRDTYPYGISLRCVSGSGDTIPVVIDPEIIIDHGGASMD
jgi:hypothetical protein